MYQDSYGNTVRGLVHKMKMMDSIMDNIAKSGVIGFKKAVPQTMSFQTLLEDFGLRSRTESKVLKDESQGNLVRTGSMFDLAIDGNANFMVEGKDGIELTRVGKFLLNEKGNLATVDGREVVITEKTDKDITLSRVNKIVISEDGVINVDGEKFGRIAMKVEDNKPVRLIQGFVEGSNVNILTEMANLTSMFRSFESSEKLLGMEQAVDKELVEKYGRNV